MLSLENIAVTQNNITICTNLSVSFLAGSIVNIFGVNGSGKTTLLKVMAGLKEFEQGQIIYNVKEPYKEIRYLGHQNALKEYFSVYENISFWAKLTKNDSLIEPALNYFALEQIKHKNISKLSAGQKKLVAIAKLMVNPGKIWLLDEPFSNLDEINKHKLQHLISAKVNDGGIVVFTAHSIINFMDVLNFSLANYK
ncbi:MAG: heme ABC exporter ATP-binding protein CcmA [Rickettsiales bacterium]